jgi:hypothetical protein
MRVDNRVAQVPPVRTRQPDNEATSRSPANNRRKCTRGKLPSNPNRTWALAGGPSQGGNSAGGAGGNRDVVPHRDPGGGGSDGGSSSHRAIAAAEATQTATPPVSHAAATMPVAESRKFDATNPQVRTRASPPSLLDFAICCSQRNSSLWGLLSTTRSKTQYSGLGAAPYPSRTLVATTTRSVSTSPSVWTKLHLHGSSHSRSIRSISGTSSRSSSPATSRAPWDARVLAWT